MNFRFLIMTFFLCWQTVAVADTPVLTERLKTTLSERGISGFTKNMNGHPISRMFR